MLAELECEGAPRDLGLDQGHACRPVLRDRFARVPWRDRWALRAGRVGERSERLARDVRRHFPHQSESMDGIARGARVPGAWLARELLAHATHGGGSAIARSRASDSPAFGLVRGIPDSAVLRRSRPEGGFRSLELTLPWIPAALAGVNEAGLAVVALGSTWEGGASAAPALLLTQDCLRRLDSIEAALEWCSVRPTAGRTILLLADARGDVAGVEITGAAQRVLRPSASGVLAPGAEGEVLAKTLGEVPLATLEDLARHFGDHEADPACVVLDPAARRLGLFGGVPGATSRWLDL